LATSNPQQPKPSGPHASWRSTSSRHPFPNVCVHPLTIISRSLRQRRRHVASCSSSRTSTSFHHLHRPAHSSSLTTAIMMMICPASEREGGKRPRRNSRSVHVRFAPSADTSRTLWDLSPLAFAPSLFELRPPLGISIVGGPHHEPASLPLSQLVVISLSTSSPCFSPLSLNLAYTFHPADGSILRSSADKGGTL